MSVNKLIEQLKEYSKIAVSFSGGIDSTYLLYMARKVLGKANVIAVIIESELTDDAERDYAIKIAKNVGVNYVLKQVNELSIQEIKENHPNSWYYRKKLFYQTVIEIAKEHGIHLVVDGAIMDDLSDYRPGMKAKEELNILSPLIEAEFYKSDVLKELEANGFNLDKQPSGCSFSSRFPYYTTIDNKKIEQVKQAENILTQLGFKPLRVRHHDTVARIEVSEQQILKLIENRDEILIAFEKIGFKYTSMDLAGYNTGSMNKTLRGI